MVPKKYLSIGLIFFLIIVSCDKSKKEYDKAMEIGSIQAYEKFINNNPESKYVQFAIAKVESLSFYAALSENSISSFENFMLKYPQTKFTQNAENILDSLRYSELESIDSLESYITFVKTYPKSNFLDAAKHRIDELTFSVVKNKDRIEDYEKFISEYPNNPFVSEAKKRIKVLKSAPPTDSQSIDILETEIGQLKKGFAILKGASIGMRDGEFILEFGYIAIEQGFGYSLNKDLVVTSRTEPLPEGRKMQITLVQEKSTAQWIATNGIIVVDDYAMLAEGHVVRVVGGRDNPVKICGRAFSDTTIVIRGGQPTLYIGK